MAWFAELAGKAESLLNNLDEQTGAALRNHNVSKPRKLEKNEHQFESTLSQKRRPLLRNQKKITPVTETRSTFTPNGRLSPSQLLPFPQNKNGIDNSKNGSPKPKKSLSKRSSPPYTLEHCPKTLVGDIKENEVFIDQFGLKSRRYSLPADLEVANQNEWTYQMQDLEVENAMLKNELNVMNREVSELLDRLRKTEDGNDVDNVDRQADIKLSKTHTKLKSTEVENNNLNSDNESMLSQLSQLKQKINEISQTELEKFKENNQSLETQVTVLTERNKDLEDKIKQQTEKLKEKDVSILKVDTELRHAQSTISELQNNLEKTTTECHRLEKDWETYKLRVKSMLQAKDKEIQGLQDGLNLTEDTKMLMEQLDILREERDELSEAVSRIRDECGNTKQYVERLEDKHNAAERVVAALRDALRDERVSRNRAEAHCLAIGKELKSLQFESGQTIASLRTALRDKENELVRLRESNSSVRSTDTSALNVGDYDVTQDSIDTEKIHYLTQTLVQRQGKIDSLLADNNILRIQLEKLETKYKTEIASIRSHSVVHVQDSDGRYRTRNNIPDSTMMTLSMRMGVMIKRYPIFRILILIYMIGLHFWVLTVLLTSTPEDYVPRPNKS